MEIDPVCGMEVDPDSAKYKTLYESKRYYFCAKGCLDSFEKNPGRYLEKKSADPPSPPAISNILPPARKMEMPADRASDLSFAIKGMSCASCVARIEDSLKKVNGIYEASVNLANGIGVVRYDPKQVDFPKIRKAVEKAGGYEAELQDRSPCCVSYL